MSFLAPKIINFVPNDTRRRQVSNYYHSSQSVRFAAQIEISSLIPASLTHTFHCASQWEQRRSETKFLKSISGAAAVYRYKQTNEMLSAAFDSINFQFFFFRFSSLVSTYFRWFFFSCSVLDLRSGSRYTHTLYIDYSHLCACWFIWSAHVWQCARHPSPSKYSSENPLALRRKTDVHFIFACHCHRLHIFFAFVVFVS